MKRGLFLVCFCTLAGLALLIAGIVSLDAARGHLALIALCGALGWFAAVFAYFNAFEQEMKDPPP